MSRTQRPASLTRALTLATALLLAPVAFADEGAKPAEKTEAKAEEKKADEKKAEGAEEKAEAKSEPTPVQFVPQPAKKVKARFVSFEDNGSGNTLTVRGPRGKKLQFFLPPDGSGKGLGELKKGAKLEVTYADTIEKRVGDVRLATKKKAKKVLGKRGRALRRVKGTFKSKQQGDMGNYIVIERDGKDETWLGDFELSGGLDFEKDVGKEVVLTYVEFKRLEYRGFETLD